MADTNEIPEQTAPAEEKPEEKPEEKTEPEEDPDDEEWKADKYRNKVVERIQEEIDKTESQVPKSAKELEEFVFAKAKSRKSYRDLVTRLLIYVGEFNKKKNKDSEQKEKGKKEEGKEGDEKVKEEGSTEEAAQS